MKRLLFLLLLSGTIQSKAQTSGEDKLGNWLMYFGTNTLSEKYSLHTEAQLRLYEPINNFNQLLLRIGINRHINHHSFVTLGYGYIPTATFEKDQAETTSIEHRIWEQFILKNTVGRIYFEHRYRLEQRWISAASEDTYLNRARYRIQLIIPLNKPEMIDHTLFTCFYDEIFLNIADSPFDQNRLYAALGYKLNKVISLQTGYLRHRLGDNNFNRLQLAVFLTPN